MPRQRHPAPTKAPRPTPRKGNHEKYREKPLESDVRRQKKAQKALDHRKKCAEQAEMVKNGSVTVKQAAQECGISERHMARQVAKALKEKAPCSETTATNSPAQ